METIKVVRKSKLGYAIINKSDFDPKTMKIFGGTAKPKSKTKKK